MRILMMTNTYAPVIGGIEESVHSFSNELRQQGHQVVIVTPEFEGMQQEEDVIRIPAFKNVLRHDFSVTLPIPIALTHFVRKFRPDVIHSHQFFLIGDMALRLARFLHVPLVYTHHILLEQYVDLLPVHSPRISRFILKLATGYANLADSVIAPSQAVYDVLERSGVRKPMNIIPTGIDLGRFAWGEKGRFRDRWQIPSETFVAGCVCRLMPEKNLGFLAVAASLFLRANCQAHIVIVGDGIFKEEMEAIFREQGVAARTHFTGVLQGQELIDAYHAMDVFMFSSHSETQGLVLLEAMACKTPAIVVRAPAFGNLVEDHWNGRVIDHDDPRAFADALAWFAALDHHSLEIMKRKARAKAGNFSMTRCAQRLLEVYRGLADHAVYEDQPLWSSVKDCLTVEKDLLQNAIKAAEAAFRRKSAEKGSYV